ncbi:MAG: hypothetical protein ACRDK4_04985 [Solirubrobacteraceae bacterium]
MVADVNQLANATLIEIAKPGPLANNGDPGTPVPVWAGEALGTLERTRKEGTGERETPGKHVTFKIFDASGAPAVELAGTVATASTVVIEDRSLSTPVTSRWTVKGTVREAEGTLDNFTLELDGETTP